MKVKFIALIIILECLLFLRGNSSIWGQPTDEKVFKDIYNFSLTEGKTHDWLGYLSVQIGSRLVGSYGAERAVSYTQKELENLSDRVWLQSVIIPKWVRNLPEYAYAITKNELRTEMPICALGGSIATPSSGIKAKVIMVSSFDELQKLGKENVAGKIVFYNRAMDPSLINTLKAYSEAVDQRIYGAEKAAKLGAVGVIVRSMNLQLDDYPHTGNVDYGDLPKSEYIPAAAISTNGAELLKTMLKLYPDLSFYFRQYCKSLKNIISHNVIAEIKGSTYPNQIIAVGAHLNSWDLGDGSHNNGAGVVQSMEVLRILKKINYQPKRTIRVVLSMDEENDLRGSKKYAQIAKNKAEQHILALENNLGGFSPQGFTFEGNEKQFTQINAWKKLFAPYKVHSFAREDRVSNIHPLKKDGIVLARLRPDIQRYFYYHYAATDTFEAVNKRELELGAAAMTALVYLYDKYGVAK